jgi:hypothetical protein
MRHLENKLKELRGVLKKAPARKTLSALQHGQALFPPPTAFAHPMRAHWSQKLHP